MVTFKCYCFFEGLGDIANCVCMHDFINFYKIALDHQVSGSKMDGS